MIVQLRINSLKKNSFSNECVRLCVLDLPSESPTPPMPPAEAADTAEAAAA